MNENITRFEVGKVYKFGYICNADAVVFVKVTKRTACTVTIEGVNGSIFRAKTCRILADYSALNKAETVRPEGSYSMAPVLRANRAA